MIPTTKMVVVGAKPGSNKITALETVNEMIDYGISSQAAGSWQSLISQTLLNPSDYDGTVSYYFEILAVNGNASNDYNVLLKSGADTYATITIPKNTGSNYTRYRSTAITPAAGENTYFIEVPQTDADNNVRIMNARLIVVQSGTITKTRIQIPLSNGGGANYANTDATNYSGTQTSQQYRGHYWLREDAQLKDYRSTNPYRFTAIAKTSDGSGVATIGLRNVTDGANVTGADLTTSETSYTMLSAYLAQDATNLHDGDDHCLYYKSNNSSYTTSVGKVRLYVYLENLSKAIIYRSYRGPSNSTSERYGPWDRHLIDLTNYPNSTIYFESTGLCNENITAVSLGDDGTSDSDTSSDSDVTGSGINFNSATIARLRTNAITLTDDRRYYPHFPATTASKTINGCCLVIKVG